MPRFRSLTAFRFAPAPRTELHGVPVPTGNGMTPSRFLDAVRRAVVVAAPALALAAPAQAQAIERPLPTLVRNVTFDRTGESDARAHVLLRGGRIEAILPADAPTPKGMRVVEGDGLLCLPAFVDAYTRQGIETPQPEIDQDLPVDTGSDVRVDMRLANRKGIQPAFRAAEALAFGAEDSEPWREAGFGAAQIAPSGELLAGTSCLAAAREAAMRDLVIQSDVFACAAFEATGGGYPSTLMGYHSQLRQFFLDAARHVELEARFANGRPGPRPPFDADFAAGAQILDGTRALLCRAQSHRDVERWVKLADAFGFELAFQGGRDAWRVADLLADRNIPVLLTLGWGKEVDDPDGNEEDEAKDAEADDAEEEEEAAEEDDPAEEEVETIDWKYEEPLEVRRERRRKWEERRDGAIRLHEAGVRFAFGTDSEKPSKLLERVRELVEAGLPEEVAFAALTSTSADLCGVGKRLGRVAPGYDATLTLWNRNPLTEKKAKAIFVIVDGYVTEYERPEEKEGAEGAPDEGVDVTGTWLVKSESDGEESEADLTLEMAEDGSVEGVLIQANPMDQSTMTIDVTGAVVGTTLELSGSFAIGDTEVEFTYELEIEGDELSGEVTIDADVLPEPMVRSVEGARSPSLF